MFVLLIKASLVIVILLAFYKLFLEKESFFAVNRIYLLACLFLAIAIPFITLPELIHNQGYIADLIEKKEVKVATDSPSFEELGFPIRVGSNAEDRLGSDDNIQNEVIPIVEPQEEIIISEVLSEVAIESAEKITNPIEKQGFGLAYWLFWIYLFGVSILTLNLLAQIAGTLFKAIRNEDKIQDEEGTIVNLEEESEPCSFFKYIFIYPDNYDFDTYEQILAHEKIHVKQWHSIDLLISEIAVILLWFNPFVWLFRKEVEKNIEYQTDDLLTKKEPQAEKKGYQLNLLKIATYNKPLTITTNYNQSLIKQRILKMNTKKSNPYSYWKYAFVAPLVFVLLLILNQPNAVFASSDNNNITDSSNETQQQKDDLATVILDEAENTEDISNEEEFSVTNDDNSDCQKLLAAVEKDDEIAVRKILQNFDLDCTPSTDVGDAGNFEYIRFAAANDADIIINNAKRQVVVIGKQIELTVDNFDLGADFAGNQIKASCKEIQNAVKKGDVAKVRKLLLELDKDCIENADDPKVLADLATTKEILQKGAGLGISELRVIIDLDWIAGKERTVGKNYHSEINIIDAKNWNFGDESDGAINNDCKTLIKAILAEDVAVVKELIAKTDVNCIDLKPDQKEVNTNNSRYFFLEPRTPLVAAARVGNLEVGKLLVEAGAKVDFQAQRDETPIMAAAESDALDFVKYLHQKGANINKEQQGEGSVLSVAARAGSLEVVKYLLEQGTDIQANVSGEGTPLSVAARSGHLEVVKYLLSKGADLNSDTRGEGTPLSVSARSGHLEVVKYLLDQGADINAQSIGEGTPLSVAARSGHMKVVKFLLEEGADINTDSHGEGTPLSVAARSGHLEVVKFLLSKGANINADSHGEGTPLSVAARSGHLGVVKYLIAQKADINAESVGEGTPLSVAARSGHLEVVKYLLDQGANINAEARGEGTPLSVAARSGHLETVKLLLGKGADIETGVRGEGTPLTVAARSGHLEVVKYLVKNGADINSHSEAEGTPLSVARRSGHQDIVKYLKAQGAEF